MNLLKLFYALFKIKLLTPLGIYRLVNAVLKCGTNIMALLTFSTKAYGDKIALVDDNEIISYNELLIQTKKLATILIQKYDLGRGKKIAFLCKNHAVMVKGLFAAALLGTDIYMLNAEMSIEQFNRLVERHGFDFLVYDFELTEFVEKSDYANDKIVSYHHSLPAVNNLVDMESDFFVKFKPTSWGKIVLLTGGTSGSFKEAAHKPSLFNYLSPFISLLTRLNVMKYNSAYIATPIYHGYGIAVLILSVAMGKKVIISKGFNTEKACSLVRRYNVEVITVVPLMIDKMMKHNINSLRSVECIISGGAKLNPKIVEEVFNKLGNVLYNMYGTSETGLNMIATPADLEYSALTIGRKIKGLRLKVLDSNDKEVKTGTVGQFCVKNNWSMRNKNNSWIKTGDIGYRDEKDYYFLCGRVDDMVVSAGENVYPIELERILIRHPQIDDVAVIGISDEKFGSRLKAFVLPAASAQIEKDKLIEWLKPKVARYQMPKEIVFVDSMPYTPVGKLDKKKLN